MSQSFRIGDLQSFLLGAKGERETQWEQKLASAASSLPLVVATQDCSLTEDCYRLAKPSPEIDLILIETLSSELC